jgi:hypothetical protein
LDEANPVNNETNHVASNENWTAISAAIANQQHISKDEVVPPYHPTQHMFMIKHVYTLLKNV